MVARVGAGDSDELRLRFAVKAQLRDRMRDIRRRLPATAHQARSAAAAANVMALPEYASARTIAAYAARGRELSLATVIADAFARGVRVALPRVDAERSALVLHEHTAGSSLVAGAFGIDEPAPDAQVVEPSAVDVVLIPALAVDERGFRVGYGGAYYDGLLPSLPRALRIAVVYAFQRVPEVPNTPGDVPVHVVVTDEGVFRGTGV